MLSAMILCFHTRSEAGPRIDRLKFDRLVDELKTEEVIDPRSRSLMQRSTVMEEFVCKCDRLKECQKIGYKHASNWRNIGLRGQENDHHQMTKMP